MSRTPYKNENELKVALPKGRLMSDVRGLMDRVGLKVPDYDESSRVYRLTAESPEGVFVKVLSDRDIPVQVAVGNYDIGIAGSDWVKELVCKYRRIAIVRVMGLGFGSESLYAASSPGMDIGLITKRAEYGYVRIVSQYPNLSDLFAREMRFKRYRVFPVWGAEEAYIPDGADIAVIKAGSDEEIEKLGLTPIHEIMRSEATLIAHKGAFEQKDLTKILDLFT